MDDVILKTMEDEIVYRLNELVAIDESARERAASLPELQSSLPEAMAIVSQRRIIRAEQDGLEFGINVIRTTRRMLHAQKQAS